MSDTILSQDHKNWTEITLNRPEKLNSFNDEMHIALRKTLKNVISNGKRAVMITGAGRGFCAGQDLSDRVPDKTKEKLDLSQTLKNFYNPLIRIIHNADIPIICAVNGVAAGAGANLALACDLVIASDKAKFIQSFVNVALVPDAGGTWNLTRLLGTARAKGLMMTGEPIFAQQAYDWGMIWKVVTTEELMIQARELTQKIADGPTNALAHIKKAVHAADVNTLDQQLELEASYQKICGNSQDYVEGVRAFMEKRKPTFEGK